MRLVLFDIDGTLLRCGKQVAKHFLGALEAVFGGYHLPERFSFAGKTDPMIAVELVRGLGLDEEEIHARLPRARDLYVEAISRELDRDRMLLLPGVVELLDRLVAASGTHRRLAHRQLAGRRPRQALPLRPRGLLPLRRLRRRRPRPPRTRAGGDAPSRTPRAGNRVDPSRRTRCSSSATPCSMSTVRAPPARSAWRWRRAFTEAEELEAAGADWVFDDLRQATRHLAFFAA